MLISQNAYSNLYVWDVDRVIDGDTVSFFVDFLPEPLPAHISVRLYGIDAPERNPRSRCDKENQLAEKSTEFTKKLISKGDSIIVNLRSWDKYGGRVLGDIMIDDVMLSDVLVENGFAVKYDGKIKNSWCD